MPGHAKTFSTNSAPPSSAGSMSPSSVTIGVSAVRSAWRQTIWRSESPFARAVRMKSDRQRLEHRGALIARDAGHRREA